MSNYLTTSELAEILRRSPATVRAMAREGRLPAVRLTPGGPMLFDAGEVERSARRPAEAPAGAASSPGGPSHGS